MIGVATDLDTGIEDTARISVLDLLIIGLAADTVGERHGLATDDVRRIAVDAGWPDATAMRRTRAALKKKPRMPFGPPARKVAPRRVTEPAPEQVVPPNGVVEEDHPALALVGRLSLAVRDGDQEAIAAILERNDRGGLGVLVLMMAAIIPPDVDLDAATEWLDLPPEEWTADTMWREVRRHKHGANDRTAVAAATEADRRAQDQR